MTTEEARKILEKNAIPNPGINLLPGEVCYFAGEAAAIVSRNQNIGTTYSSFGTGLPWKRTSSRAGFYCKYGILRIANQAQSAGTFMDRLSCHGIYGRILSEKTRKARFLCYVSPVGGRIYAAYRSAGS